MDLPRSILLATLCTELFMGYAYAAYCSQLNVDRCLSPLEEYGLIEDPENPASVPIHDEETWKEICVLTEEAYDCIYDLDHCDTSDTLMYMGLIKADKYLCDDGFELFIEAQTCLRSDQVSYSAGICEDSLDNQLSHGFSYFSSLSTLCKYIENYMKCLTDAVEYHCGKDAAKFEKKYDFKLIQPMADYIGCDFADDGLSTGAILGIIIAVLVVIALVIATVALVHQSRKKKERHERMQRQLGTHTTPGQTVIYPGSGAGAMAAPPAYDNHAFKKSYAEDNMSLPPAYEEKPSAPSPYNPYLQTNGTPQSGPSNTYEEVGHNQQRF